MKKLILSSAFAIAALTASAQGGSTGPIEAAAIKAAKDAGCTGDYTGPLETSVGFLGGCASGPATTAAWNEVLVTRKVNPNEAPYVRYAPFARVTFCGNEILTVECLQ